MSFFVRPATSEDNDSILELLNRNYQPGRVQLAFERQPDYFHSASVTCEVPDVYVLESPKQRADGAATVAGVFNLGHRQVFVNGEPRNVRYAHDLRLDNNVRGGSALAACYRHGKEMMADGEWMQAVILAENASFLSSVSRSREGMPDLYSTGDIETYLLTGIRSPARDDSALTIRAATRADASVMQAFIDKEGRKRQFFPHYQIGALLDGAPYYRDLKINQFWLLFRGEELVAMAGIWDQKEFKQSRVVGYSSGLSLARPVYNAWRLIGNGLRLPSVGSCFEYLMVHSILVKGNEPAFLESLLHRLQRSYGPYYDALVCGFFTSDPLRKSVDRFQRRVLGSRHFLLSWDGDPRPELDDSLLPYVDVARL